MVSQKRVQIGLLHSQTGTMAISELPLLEAEMLAIDEINANGGVLRHKIEYIIEDGASDPEIFAKKAASLILKNNISVLFGGWNSHSRKAVKRIVEKHNALFWYPMQYEGLEESTNIFYYVRQSYHVDGPTTCAQRNQIGLQVVRQAH